MLREAIIVNDWLNQYPDKTIRFKKETFVIFRAFIEDSQDCYEISFINEEQLLQGGIEGQFKNLPKSVKTPPKEMEEVFRCSLKLFRKEAENHGDDLVRQIFKGIIYLKDGFPEISYERVYLNKD